MNKRALGREKSCKVLTPSKSGDRLNHLQKRLQTPKTGLLLFPRFARMLCLRLFQPHKVTLPSLPSAPYHLQWRSQTVCTSGKQILAYEEPLQLVAKTQKTPRSCSAKSQDSRGIHLSAMILMLPAVRYLIDVLLPKDSALTALRFKTLLAAHDFSSLSITTQ